MSISSLVSHWGIVVSPDYDSDNAYELLLSFAFGKFGFFFLTGQLAKCL